MNKRYYWIISIACLSVLLLITALLSLGIGSSGIFIGKIIRIIFSGKGSVEYSVLMDVRLPRLIAALSAGMALSVSGVILQALFRNPLVEPYTLGISGGAALGVTITIVLGLSKANYLLMPLSGFAGALSVLSVIYLLSLKRGFMRINKLLLAGVMLSFLSTSVIMLIMSLAKTEELSAIIFWTMGSLEEPNILLLKALLILSLAGLTASYFFCADLNAFSLGEEEAAHLGINTENTKKILFLMSSVLTGCTVAVTGMIGFVGLAIPHFARMVFGSDHRILLAASALSGAIFLILCDAVARTVIAPAELPVGVITGIIGGTLFIYFLSKKN